MSNRFTVLSSVWWIILILWGKKKQGSYFKNLNLWACKMPALKYESKVRSYQLSQLQKQIHDKEGWKWWKWQKDLKDNRKLCYHTNVNSYSKTTAFPLCILKEVIKTTKHNYCLFSSPSQREKLLRPTERFPCLLVICLSTLSAEHRDKKLMEGGHTWNVSMRVLSTYKCILNMSAFWRNSMHSCVTPPHQNGWNGWNTKKSNGLKSLDSIPDDVWHVPFPAGLHKIILFNTLNKSTSFSLQ